MRVPRGYVSGSDVYTWSNNYLTNSLPQAGGVAISRGYVSVSSV